MMFGWGCERGSDKRDGLRKVNWETEWNNNCGKTTKGEGWAHGSETALKEEIRSLVCLKDYAVKTEMTPVFQKNWKKNEKL